MKISIFSNSNPLGRGVTMTETYCFFSDNPKPCGHRQTCSSSHHYSIDKRDLIPQHKASSFEKLLLYFTTKEKSNFVKEISDDYDLKLYQTHCRLFIGCNQMVQSKLFLVKASCIGPVS